MKLHGGRLKRNKKWQFLTPPAIELENFLMKDTMDSKSLSKLKKQ